MAKVKQPLLSLDARRKLGDDIVFTRRGGSTIVEKRPEPQDARSVGQLSWRHMFQKVVALWHALSAAEKEAWESLARSRHMTGYAWFVSQALRPNPGIYLPLQGGVMQGIIDMDGFAIQDLLDPVNPQDADTEAARDAAIADALEDCIDSHIHGWDTSNWQKLLVESATQHNLRVTLYTGANIVNSAVMTANELTSSGTRGLLVSSKTYLHYSATKSRAWQSAALGVDGIAGANTGQVALWAYNGATWDRLRTESNSAFNLRVRLYAGADAIHSNSMTTNWGAGKRGLGVVAALAAYDGGNTDLLMCHSSAGDAVSNALEKLLVSSFLRGYNGATWDMLRTYGTGILKVGRAEIGLSTLRRVGAGAVKGSAGTLYWITMNPTAPNSVIELTDDLDGSTAVVWDMTHGANSAHHMNLDPPMEFSTGIWLKTLTNFTSVIFGYK